MANYTATTRSNYFAVKDEAAFTAWCAQRSLHHWDREEDGQPRRFAISADTGDCCGWPMYDWADDGSDTVEIDFPEELAQHLAEGEVAVLIEIGNEKLRYLTGCAVAVDHTGETLVVSLDDIYEEAAKAFGRPLPTSATY